MKKVATDLINKILPRPTEEANRGMLTPRIHNMRQKAWRYMTFSRFVWLLQQRRIWMARVDKLDDEWEMALAGEQLKHVYAIAPVHYIGSPPMPENIKERTKRVLGIWRRETYVSCWCASAHESHALWRIYCGPNEGVSIQTNLVKLQQQFQNISVYNIRYEHPGRRKSTPVKLDLATIKRPMFSYEHEVRFIAEPDYNNPNLSKGELGFEYAVKPEEFIDRIVIHPLADSAFLETVVSIVDAFAPSLKDKVIWSEMRGSPPLVSDL